MSQGCKLGMLNSKNYCFIHWMMSMRGLTWLFVPGWRSCIGRGYCPVLQRPWWPTWTLHVSYLLDWINFSEHVLMWLVTMSNNATPPKKVVPWQGRARRLEQFACCIWGQICWSRLYLCLFCWKRPDAHIISRPCSGKAYEPPFHLRDHPARVK